MMTDKRLHSPDTTPNDIRFVNVPSIAQRKLGTDYSAPMRLDPRLLDQMQATIKTLEADYLEALRSQVSILETLLPDAIEGNMDARDRLYMILHDMRGLAGTFGHPLIGCFAGSLCTYFEQQESLDWQNNTIIRFHIDAIRDALENPETDTSIALETLHALDRLIKASEGTGRMERMQAG